jgi:hypothetical protein
MRQRRLWNDVINHDIGQSEAWDKYTSHVTRRNVVVHEGGPFEAADASDSIEAVEHMIDYAEDLRRSRGTS